MNPNKQRIAIAEACGWTPRHHPAFDPLALYGKPPGKEDGWERVPNYLNDLNAMHEAEETLSAMDGEKYAYELEKVVAQIVTKHCRMFKNSHATAAQRAKALLRVKGLWEE